MYISVQFKDRNKVFKGKTYDYKLHEKEKTPKVGEIVRLMDEDYNWLHNGTRVKIISVNKSLIDSIKVQKVRYLISSMEE